ncbi:unnamed protein product [Lepidochelys kempii]
MPLPEPGREPRRPGSQRPPVLPTRPHAPPRAGERTQMSRLPAAFLGPAACDLLSPPGPGEQCQAHLSSLSILALGWGFWECPQHFSSWAVVLVWGLGLLPQRNGDVLQDWARENLDRFTHVHRTGSKSKTYGA